LIGTDIFIQTVQIKKAVLFQSLEKELSFFWNDRFLITYIIEGDPVLIE